MPANAHPAHQTGRESCPRNQAGKKAEAVGGLCESPRGKSGAWTPPATLSASDMRSLISTDTEEPLDQNGLRPQVTPYAFRACRPASSMSKICSITGSRVTRGSVIHRRGMAKKKGGVGRHVTKNVRREFHPNLHEHRVWVPEIKKFVRIRVTARGLKTINKNGAYRALKKAGVIAG